MNKNKSFLSLPTAGQEGILGNNNPAQAKKSRVTTMERALVRRLLQMLDKPPVTVVLWNGESITESTATDLIRIEIRDRGALYKLLTRPNLNFGDLYSTGRIEIDKDKLLAFLEMLYLIASDSKKIGFLKKYIADIINKPRINSLLGSRNHINHHYDLGNDFYSLWLDHEYKQYTCAYFPDPEMSLEAAQKTKLEHVCRKLQLKPGETVVEAGCGWGGLARYMAKHYNVKVRSYNISHQQILYARERAKEEGLDHLVEYIEDDYRNISGNYDVFVSVGMLEHVGKQNYRELGEVMHRCLKEGGRGLIHSIGRNKPRPTNAWIEKRIFPGGYTPSIGEMMDIFEPRNFSVQDVENLRLHYAKTLEHWSQRFEENANAIEDMYDAQFVRAWRLYLNGSIAAFHTGTMQLFQIMFTRPRKNDLPWSREYIYK